MLWSLFLLILTYTLSAQTNTHSLQYKNLHLDISPSLPLIYPSSFFFPHYAKKRLKPSLESPQIATVPPKTPMTFDHEGRNGAWLPTKKGFVACDCYNDSLDILATKTTCFPLEIGSFQLSAEFIYSNHNNYHFSLKDKKGNILVYRERSHPDHTIRNSKPIALYALGRKKPYGCLILTGANITTFIPYIGSDGKLRVFVYQIKGKIADHILFNEDTWIEQESAHNIIIECSENAEDGIKIWSSETHVVPETNQEIRLPVIWHIKPGSKEHQPMLVRAPFPESIEDWPLEARQTWSPISILITAIQNNLPKIKTQILSKVPPSLWESVNKQQSPALSTMVPQANLRTRILREISALRQYTAEKHLSLDVLLQTQHQSPSKNFNKPSRVMVLLDT